jgi:sugar lactone lactonase YvrE
MVFSREGRHLKDIVFSARNMACTTWGGKNLDILFVATGKDRKPTGKADDEGGHMFRYRASGTKGTNKYEFQG